jgi:esterase
LLTNLKRNSEGKFEWRMNLSVIAKDYPLLKSWGEDTFRQSEFMGQTLFIKGENSDYLLPKYTDQTLAFFPKAKVKVISEAGHWVHNENPEQFFKVVQKFLME